MIIQKFFFATEIKPFSDYRSNFFTEGRERPACVDRGYAFQPPCLTPKFETGKVSTEDRRQKTSRQKKPDQKLLPQRQGPLSPKVHANERPLLHRGAQATREALPHPRFTIHDQQSTIFISLLLRVHSRFHHIAESIGAARPQRPTG
jgi:hypothetical protein